MKILRYWKNVELPDRPGFKYMIVHVHSVKQTDAFYDDIERLVKESDFSYSIHETVGVEYRGDESPVDSYKLL